jgi:LAO/AO transport system kinase
MNAGELADLLVALDKRAIGRTITRFESERVEAADEREELCARLAAHPGRRHAFFVGVTGPPGSGKSSLVGELALRLHRGVGEPAVSVLAIDPTSPLTGGALLGDRTRVRFPAGESRLFFRSQASELALGGIGRASFQVCRLLSFLFDYCFVETVGTGQSEVDVRHLADLTYLVLPPESGDELQLMKAGIMEIPDAILAHKSDLGQAAARAHHRLGAAAGLLAGRGDGSDPPRVHRTSTVDGTGLDEVVAEIAERRAAGGRPLADKEARFFERWVRDEHGRCGVSLLDERGGGAASYLSARGSFDRAQRDFGADLRRWIAD